MVWRWRGNGRQAAAMVEATSDAASASAAADVEARTQAIGRELLTAGAGGKDGRGFWSQQLLAWAMRDPKFKTELFRFIDVFPVLKTPEAVHAHLMEYLLHDGMELPTGLGAALKAGQLAKGAVARTVAGQIEAMAKQFIAGRDATDALPRLKKMWDEGICLSVDLLGEACVSEAEAAAYRQRYLALIQTLATRVAEWPGRDILEEDHLGPLPRANVSVKISALDPRMRVADFETTVERMFREMRPLLEAARDQNVLLNFDMEQYASKELTLRLFMRCCEAVDFPAGIALQAYLRSAESDARRLIEWAQKAGRVVTVRLIKGAYWDYETVHAELMNWPSPVWSRKIESDASFEKLTGIFVEAMPVSAAESGVKLALGTHNARSIAQAMARVEVRGLPRNCVEFQALHGMAESMVRAVRDRGYRVREYVPLGEMLPGMAYLVRRLLENTSNLSWVRAGMEQAGAEVLLAAPVEGAANAENARRYEFRNEPLRDFSDAKVREEFQRAVAEVSVPAVRNDADKERLEVALAGATQAFPGWRAASQVERSAIVRRAATELRQRRDELAGMIIRESGKTWEEADGDVCEAIDFCEFYAREALEIVPPRSLERLAAERDELMYEPRGVAAVISPWNFPLSIPTGMTTAALVTGNTVILKPAEQTPAIARELCEALWRAGVPRNVLHFLPGDGETIGAALVRDARVAVIAFTGSAAVGFDILRAGRAELRDNNSVQLIKHEIVEMGGKNAIIVDASADLDEAVLGVRQSAFSYSGQKCSACSRVIVLEEVYDLFLERLIGATRALTVGDPLEPGTDMGPVISAEAGQTILRFVEAGKTEARLAFTPRAYGDVRGKPLIWPHIFVDMARTSVLATEEIFGPVLAVFRVKSFVEGLELANASAYKLTGGVYSRTPSHLAAARREFRVGNLYLNRAITGALVGRQPFGGFGKSGLGTKAGGREYLLQFVLPRVVTENTLRHGFAPEAT